MWIFGYGSLMWDGWEETRGCTSRLGAELPRHCRVFNKPSIKNWGSERDPCPTLNVVYDVSSSCRGIAFQFDDERQGDVIAYLRAREGSGFPLKSFDVDLETGDRVEALVPIYEGTNVIDASSLPGLADLVLNARGGHGDCLSYLKGIAEKLRELNIADQSVDQLWAEVISSRGIDAA